ncbi:MAG: transketolase, partial [Rhodospirillales bacterium]|nr:transketolase [Rhodospirillales bacterium]
MPMGMADVATVLFARFLKFDPARPDWPNRDRFVLSAGHGSMLLYALLYLTGYKDITLNEIRNFRQLDSKCAGHPEYGAAPGIETTTGPLGQGFGNAVGMALAERIMAARFGADLVDHHTYVIAGDGDLMEGVSHEAASLAGHLGLGKLIVLFDDNNISIDGATDLSVSDDQLARFKSYGWDASAVDGHDQEAVAGAIAAAQQSDKPTLIACRTTIGFGAPNKQGTSGSHGAPLGEDEVAATRKALDWPHPQFEIPAPILKVWRTAGERGAPESAAWRERVSEADKGLVDTFRRAIAGDLPKELTGAIAAYKRQLSEDQPSVATRKASQMALEVINGVVPEMIGGSADLSGSVLTKTSQTEAITAQDFGGRYLHYGVREHGMAAAMNGMALYGGIIPYAGTFLVFADYCRPSIRMAALMELRAIFVMTHDSIGLGEDGPTHQPVEHLASLRAMPNLNVFRPADAVETLECWELAVRSEDTPSVLSLTRQGLPTVRTEHTDENLCARGGYELCAASGTAKVTLIATGSEVSLALNARAILEEEDIPTRVVSLPCWELFDEQDAEYRTETLGPSTVRIAVEAASTFGWERYVGPDGAVVGMTDFGASAPAKVLYKHFGITADAVAEAARNRIG